MSLSDPFSPAADPRRYVPREACERLLTQLRATLEAGAQRVLFEGPPGIGKTLLVRVLAERCAARFRAASASYPALPLDELCAWVLRELGAEGGEDPEAALLSLATSDPARPLLWIVDDAQSLPRETAVGLASLVERGDGALRLLLVATEGEEASTLLESTACDQKLRFDAPMSEAETAAYLEACLAAAEVEPAARARFDAAGIAALHTGAEGIPGRLHEGATALLRGLAPSSPAPPSAPESHAEPAPAEPAPEDEPVRGGRGGPALLVSGAALLALAVWLLRPGDDASGPGAGAVLPATEPVARSAPAPPAPAPRRPSEPAPTPPPEATVSPPAPAPLTLQVNATPWARIELDGSPIGLTPLAGIEVEPGRHRVRARMPDGRLLQRDVILSPERRHLVFE